MRLRELPVDDVWFNLGLELGLRRHTLSQIKYKSHDTRNCKAALFLQLKKVNLEGFHVKMFVNALMKVRKDDLAEKICIMKGVLIHFVCV